jgi:hypothetical protein
MADCPPYLPKSGESLVPPAGFAENKCNSCAKNSQVPIVFRKDLRATVADKASKNPPMTKPVWKQACVETGADLWSILRIQAHPGGRCFGTGGDSFERHDERRG